MAIDLFEAISQRRTHRGEFHDKPISGKDLDRITESARWSPSPLNAQPWEILSIRNFEGKKFIADLTAQAVAEQFKDRNFIDGNIRWMRSSFQEWEEKSDGVLLSEQIELPSFLSTEVLSSLLRNEKIVKLAGSFGAGKIPAKKIAEKICRTPILFLVLMNPDRSPPGNGASKLMWLGMGAMLQNMLLTATALGIGVQFLSATVEFQENRRKLRHFFKIPDSREIITLLRLGYVDRQENRSVRLPTSEFVKEETFTF